MTGIVSIVGTGTGGINAPVVTPAPLTTTDSSTDASQSSSSSSTSNAATSSSTTSFINQRVVQDPVVGSITEYLSAEGNQVISQTPTAITVAYLRNGLQADGTRKLSQVSA